MTATLTLAAPDTAPLAQLAALVAETGLDTAKSAIITERFADYETKAAEWAEKAQALTVTNEGQKAEMKMAREGRLFLRQLRLAVENTRKELKDDYLQGGRAVDAVAKHLIGLIQPTEKYLEEQEGFAVRAAAERKEALRARRHAALADYTADPNVYALADLSEESFMELLNGFVAAREAKIAAELKAEADQLAAAESEQLRLAVEAEAREAQQMENERLKAEATEREAAMKAERQAAEQARLDAERKAAELRRVADEKAAAERRQIEATAQAEREAAAVVAAAEKAAIDKEYQEALAAAEALRRAAADKEAATLKAKQASEVKEAADIKARAAAEKKAQAAPDREKLLALAAVLSAVAMPSLATAEAQQIIADVQGLLGKVNTYILKKAVEL